MGRAATGNRRPGAVVARRAATAATATFLAAGTGLGLTACGGAEETLSTDVAAPVVTTTTTLPPTTTTTIDFDRPLIQGQEPLAVDASPADIAALVTEMRGQTDDVDAQVRRLAPFPELGVPTVAQIMDVAVALAPAVEGGLPSTARIRFRTPIPGPDLAKALYDDRRAEAWNIADDQSEIGPDSSLHEQVYRKPGRDPGELELRATIQGDAGVTVVELEFAILAFGDDAAPEDGVDYLERLTAWASALPIPRSADLMEAAIETSPDAGALTLRYQLAAEDEAEAVADVLASIGSRGFRLAEGSAEERPTAGPLRLLDEDGEMVVIEFGPTAEPGVMDLEAIYSFAMVPLE